MAQRVPPTALQMPLNRTKTPKEPVLVVDALLFALTAGFSTVQGWVGMCAGFVSVPNEALGESGALTDDWITDIRLVRVWLN